MYWQIVLVEVLLVLSRCGSLNFVCIKSASSGRLWKIHIQEPGLPFGFAEELDDSLPFFLNVIFRFAVLDAAPIALNNELLRSLCFILLFPHQNVHFSLWQPT